MQRTAKRSAALVGGKKGHAATRALYLVALACLVLCVRPVHAEDLLEWQVCGPFDAKTVLDIMAEDEAELSPESGEVLGHPWITVDGVKPVIDLEEVLVPTDHALAYAYTELLFEREGDVRLGLRSDDAVAAWWNGRRVLIHDVQRGVGDAEDLVHVRARPGKNTLLLKVYDETGRWEYAAALERVRDVRLARERGEQLTDEQLLELIVRTSFDYFWNEADPVTGLIPDGAPARDVENEYPCSVAAVGFGLTGICIARERGWITGRQAEKRVIKTLKSMRDKVQHKRGFFYHFVDMRTGKRVWDCEVSSIDTALFLAGALTCRNYFDNEKITELVNELYRRIDWLWMLNGEDTLSMGWFPRQGFIEYRWDRYSEQTALLLMAIGAPENNLLAGTWHALQRDIFTYDGMTYLQATPLFLHQYSHLWVDYRDVRDAYADYFKNSRLATRAHRSYMVGLKNHFPLYSENLWGVTASKGEPGYMVWGGPPPTIEYPIDGTVVPCSAGGSLCFAPDITLPVMREVYEKYGDVAWGRYGLIDAFNPHTGWVADGYLGIDVGATMLAAENLLTANVWNWFMDSPEIIDAMREVGFESINKALPEAGLDYLRNLARDTWNCIDHFVNKDTQLPYDESSRPEYTSVSNIGLYLAALATAREMGFIAPDEARARADRLVNSIEVFPAWKGFAQCWHHVADMSPATHDTWVSVLDTGNLCLGMVVAAQAFPSLRNRLHRLLESMEWQALYDSDSGLLYGGYDVKAGELSPDWRVDSLGTDSRGAAFMAIAYGSLPAAIWSNQIRTLTERYHVKYMEPGWEGGGLFMQYLTGIFLDEQHTYAGRSAANMAYANLRHMRVNELPAWGWSSSLDPQGGYIGWGQLRDEVVTPHASVLAIEQFPHQVLANLRVLEAMGVRTSWKENGNEYPFGFRDSVNLETGHISVHYLVLDQAMLFLSLANYLENDLVRRLFLADERVQRAVQTIGDLARPEGGPDVSIYEPGLGGIKTAPKRRKQREMIRRPAEVSLDGAFSDWPELPAMHVRYPSEVESGVPPDPEHYEGTFRFMWDHDFLYMAAEIQDDQVVAEAVGPEIYKDDLVELFVDPQHDGLFWGSSNDFQIGISPTGPNGRPQHYAWFQQSPLPPEAVIAATVQRGGLDGDRYRIEARIPWDFLGVTNAGPGTVIGLSPAIHTVDKMRTESAKLNWSYITDYEKVNLGTVTLVE